MRENHAAALVGGTGSSHSRAGLSPGKPAGGDGIPRKSVVAVADGAANVELVTADRDAVDAALAAVSLSDAAEDYPAALSGGMQRRIALARALAYGGDVLLLDEPFNGLDDTLKSHIAAAFREHFSHGAIVLVTHLKEEAALFDADIIPL